MNSLDLFILIVISLFFIRGVFRGLVLELVSVAGLIFGYLIAITYVDFFSTLLIKYFPILPKSASTIISFIALFIVINIVLRFIGNILTRTLKFAMLGWLNRILGGFFGLLKGILVLSILVFLLSFIPFSSEFIEKTGAKESIVFPLLKALGPQLYEQIQNLWSAI